MRAVRFHGREDIRVEDVPEPVPEPDQVLLDNAYTGVCGTDLHVYFTPESSGFDFSTPDELTGASLPQVLGHEFSGTVRAVGERVTSVAAGDRVAVWPLVSCGRCVACRRGLPHGCRRLACQGVSSPGGGMSTSTTVPASRVFPLPAGVDLRTGALVEPMATSWHAVRRSGVRAGQSVLVLGAGPIGIGLWFALREHGVDRVVVSEPVDDRRAALEALGAHVVDASPAVVAHAVEELTDGEGVDVAFDAAGVGAAVGTGIGHLAPQGVLTVVALHERGFDFNPTPAVFAENTIVGSIAYEARDFEEVLDAMGRGAYDLTGWVETVGFDELADALVDLRAGRRLKVLVAS